ncbi:hypothetical protein B8W90_11920, partial [Staphylococcus hominis]
PRGGAGGPAAAPAAGGRRRAALAVPCPGPPGAGGVFLAGRCCLPSRRLGTHQFRGPPGRRAAVAEDSGLRRAVRRKRAPHLLEEPQRIRDGRLRVVPRM